MNKIGHVRLARRTVIAATCAAAALVACSGFAFAATNGAGSPENPQNDALRYIVGPNVYVAPYSVASNATKCPKGLYPVGGGPSSSHAVWRPSGPTRTGQPQRRRIRTNGPSAC